MYMKKIDYVKLIAASIIIVFTSCTGRFEEFNTNPDEPTDDMLDGDNFKVGAFFPTMQNCVIPTHPHQFQVSQNLVGDVYAGYMAGIGEWNQGKNGTTYAYVIDDWTDIPFKNTFVQVIGADMNVRKLVGNDITNPTVALSTIIKTASVHRLSDLYGPLPYSKIEVGGSLNIEYDSQEVLYKKFLSDLDGAINTLTDFVAQYPNSRPLEDYDLVYDGDYTKWIRFANSLRLRIAMRCVYVDNQLAYEHVKKALEHSGGLIEKNDDNAALKSGKGFIIKNPIQTMWDTYSDIRMGALMQSFMNGYEDPRLKVYFQQATINGATGYFGMRTGVAVTNKTKWKDLSSPAGLFTDPIVWFSAAETSFLKAEAALHWPGDFGGEEAMQTAYEEGIRLSFAEKGVDGADAYLQDDTKTAVKFVSKIYGSHSIEAKSDVTIKWNPSDSEERKLERIITQKWIALYPNGAEAWSEYRRTGYPAQYQVINDYSNGTVDVKIGPRRIPFPPSERRLNPENIEKATQLLGGPDEAGTPLWWDKKKH